MKLLVDLEKESVEELRKCIEVLRVVIENKQAGRPVTAGLERFHAPVSSEKDAEKLSSTAAQKFLEQEKLMAQTNLSDVLDRKYKRRG